MPVYFFHLQTPSRFERDEVGLDCADLEAAYLQACHAMPGLTADFLRDGRNPMEHAFEIADAEGSVLLELPFTELVRHGRRPARPQAAVLASLSHAERAYDLVVSVRQQIETLSREMQISREWLAQTRAMMPE